MEKVYSKILLQHLVGDGNVNSAISWLLLINRQLHLTEKLKKALLFYPYYALKLDFNCPIVNFNKIIKYFSRTKITLH